MRQVVLDTETTGLEPAEGHRIIEVGCVEMVDRRLTGNNFHQYIQPDRAIDEGAMEVHGITPEFLADKPRFGDVMPDLLAYLSGAELIIHNAPFDVGFLDNEFRLAASDTRIHAICDVIDTLVMARKMHPGQRNSLDALCKRYDVSNTHRELHGALLDSEILADVYLMMTGGQTALLLEPDNSASGMGLVDQWQGEHARPVVNLPVLRTSEEESELHDKKLEAIAEASGDCVWLRGA